MRVFSLYLVQHRSLMVFRSTQNPCFYRGFCFFLYFFYFFLLSIVVILN